MEQGWSAAVERWSARLGRWLLALARDALGNRPDLVVLVKILAFDRRLRRDTLSAKRELLWSGLDVQSRIVFGRFLPRNSE